MPIVIIESEWRETDLQCPFCHYNLYSDGKDTDCVTDKCKYHELHLTGCNYEQVVEIKKLLEYKNVVHCPVCGSAYFLKSDRYKTVTGIDLPVDVYKSCTSCGYEIKF